MDFKDLNEKYVRNGAGKVTEEDARKALDAATADKDGRRAGLLEQLQPLLNMVRDYLLGRYREVPWGTIAAIVFTTLYVLNPMDLIPDFLPFLGLLDDAAVVAACLGLASTDLMRYTRKCKKSGGG